MSRFFYILLSTALFFIAAASMPAYACDCTQTNTNASAPAVTIDYSTLSISELYPQPAEGAEEFIEIHNTGTEAVDLSQLVIRDAAGNDFTPSSGTVIAADEYLSLVESETHIGLNNSGDTVELLDNDGTIVCSSSYGKAETGLSWAEQPDGTWNWGTATPNEAPTPAAEPTANAVTTDSETTTQTQETGTTSPDVILSELLPNPTTSDTTDEWIEIHNVGSTEVTLRGWQLTDTVTTYTIPTQTLAPDAYSVFSIQDTKITLNNSGDTVYLIDGLGTILQGTAYPSAPTGESWSYLNGAWNWSTPTPNDDNSAAAEEIVATEPTNTNAESSNSTSSEVSTSLSIADLRTHDAGFEATITGVVTVEPGVFSDQYLYVQDATAGIQIYSYSKQFPDVHVGDTVTVTGTLSSTRGESRIKISSAQDCVVVSHGTAPEPVESTLLSEEQEGMLVSYAGELESKSSTKLTLDDGTIVTIKSGAQISVSSLNVGDQLSIIGIVTQYDDEYKLLPRSDDDITAASAASTPNSLLGSAARAATLDSNTAYYPLTSIQNTTFPWSILFLGACGTLCLVFLYSKILMHIRDVRTRTIQKAPLPTLDEIPLTTDDVEGVDYMD